MLLIRLYIFKVVKKEQAQLKLEVANSNQSKVTSRLFLTGCVVGQGWRTHLYIVAPLFFTLPFETKYAKWV